MVVVLGGGGDQWLDELGMKPTQPQPEIYKVTQQGYIFGLKNNKKSDAQAKQKYLPL